MEEEAVGNTVEIDRSYSVDPDMAIVDVRSFEVTSDSIAIAVRYSGGCKEHKFRLISKDQYMKSLPPQLPLFLDHQDGEDVCRQLVEDTLLFDLTPIRFENHNELVIRINGSEQTAIYSYQK